jgi:hypothetical protein
MSKTLKAAPKPRADELPPIPVAVAGAIKALHAGQADEHQQGLALQWILREACGKAYFPYHPSERDTAFALGRQFVADAIIGLFNADLSALRSVYVHEESDSQP